MICETFHCSKCERDIPVNEVNHEIKCHGKVGSDSDGFLYESSLTPSKDEPEIPVLFQTRSQRDTNFKESYPKVPAQYCREDTAKRYQEKLNKRTKDVRLSLTEKTVLCPRCSEPLLLKDIHQHRCSYVCCNYCHEYYPSDVVKMHGEYCQMNPFRRMENPYSQNPKEINGMIESNDTPLSQNSSQNTLTNQDSNPIINRQEEVVTMEDGSQILRIITTREHGHNVEERRIRRPQNQSNSPSNQNSGVAYQPIRAFHESSQITHSPQSQQPQQPAPQQTPSPESNLHFPPTPNQNPNNVGEQALTIFNPLMNMFFPGRTLQDNFGSFFMFGQHPVEPMMQGRHFNMAFEDPFSNLLRDHVNFIRINRGRVFEPNFFMEFTSGPQDPSAHDGMKKETISEIPIKEFKPKPDVKEGEEEKCPICLVELKEGDKIRALPCNHIFHPNCIDTWLVKNSACPICKRDVREELNSQKA